MINQHQSILSCVSCEPPPSQFAGAHIYITHEAVETESLCSKKRVCAAFFKIL